MTARRRPLGTPPPVALGNLGTIAAPGDAVTGAPPVCAARRTGPAGKLGACLDHGGALGCGAAAGEGCRPLCNGCGKPVEEARYCYAIPTCYACLPPPPELPVLMVAPVVPKARVRQGEAQLSDAIRELLSLEPGLLLMRNAQCAVVKAKRMVRGGLGNGSADLVGVLAVAGFAHHRTDEGGALYMSGAALGRFLALEVKMPGEIPTTERIAGMVAAFSPTLAALWRARGWCPEVERQVKALRPTWAHDLAQWAWLADVRRCGGFAAYVDSPASARAAVARARTGASC